MTDKQKQKLVAEAIWLDYFNRYLYEHKTISYKEYLRMNEKIAEHIGAKRDRLRSGGVDGQAKKYRKHSRRNPRASA